MTTRPVSAPVRALVVDPERISPALYRRFWRRAQLDALLPDLMVRGEPYLALNALVLPADDVALLDRLTAVFARVFHAAGQCVAADVATTMALGFPWAAAELLARETPRLPLIGRFDFVREADERGGRWRLLEQNADTPSGVREGIACDRIVADLLPEAVGLARPTAALGDQFVAAVLGALRLVQRCDQTEGPSRARSVTLRQAEPVEGSHGAASRSFAPRRVAQDDITTHHLHQGAVRGGGRGQREGRLVAAGRALGIVTTASELEDLSQMAYTADLLRPALAAHDVEVVLADAGNLRYTRRGLTLRGQPIDALYRYLPFEAVFGTPTFIAMEEAAALGRATILNGLYGLLLQNKGLLAWIWERRDDANLFDPEARAAIREHLPATWMADAVPPERPRQDLVAKQVFGREGAEVFFGEDCDATTWATLLGRQTYVVQERVHVAPVRAVVQTSLGPVVRDGFPTVGCFAVAGRFGGFYTRFGEKITTSRSKWLATYAAGAGESRAGKFVAAESAADDTGADQMRLSPAGGCL